MLQVFQMFQAMAAAGGGAPMLDPSALPFTPTAPPPSDNVLLGAIFAVTQKDNVGLFGSYVLGARTTEGGFVDVGDVAGLDRGRDGEIQAEIAREGLLTGRRIERTSAAGKVTGLDLRPHIVVTVRFEGLVKDGAEDEALPKLRDPKIVAVRADKGPFEADTTRALTELWVRQRMG
jgi:DNA ligase-1